MITRLDATIDYVTSDFACLSGFTRHEVLGDMPAISTADVRDRVFQSTQQETPNSYRPYDGLFVNVMKKGEVLYGRVVIRPFAEKAGTATHVVSPWKDAHERVEAVEREMEPSPVTAR